MSIARLTDVLNIAQRDKSAIGAFNVFNWESAQAVVRAAEKERYPVIVMFYYPLIEELGLRPTAALVRALAADAQVPVVVHLDHSADGDSVVQAAHLGYTSVMFDGSTLPLAENTARTKQLRQIVHLMGVDIEGELGYIGQATEPAAEAALTDPQEAARFAEKTRVDALAVAVGNAHGLYRERPKLAFDHLARMAQLTTTPLVLHGGTGIPDEDIREAIRCGIRKINVGTQLYMKMHEGMASEFAKETPDVFQGLRQSGRLIEDLVRERIQQFRG